MIVISDSSPLITLARARHLQLLREFYGRILIPRAVQEEVTVVGTGLPKSGDLEKIWRPIFARPKFKDVMEEEE